MFEDAKAEQKSPGNQSEVHLIIFDEIDSICKKRGSGQGTSSSVNDSLVNQLLTVLDGYNELNELNNILVVGITNRKDLPGIQ